MIYITKYIYSIPRFYNILYNIKYLSYTIVIIYILVVNIIINIIKYVKYIKETLHNLT